MRFCVLILAWIDLVLPSILNSAYIFREDNQKISPHAQQLYLRGGDGRVHPGIAWSQREGSLLCKVDMPAGVHTSEGLKVTDTHLVWKEGNIDLEMEFFDGVKGQEATVFCDGGRQTKITVPKSGNSWWPRLTKGPKPIFVKIDWATWKDDNEAETSKYSATPNKANDDEFNYDMNKDDDLAKSDKKSDASAWVDDDKEEETPAGDKKDTKGPATEDELPLDTGVGKTDMTDS